MVASEQNRMLSIVTPSDVLDCEACTGDPSLPYADRVFAGTPFADAVKAIAKSAAPPPITFKIFMWPPRFRQECLEVSQHFHAQPGKQIGSGPTKLSPVAVSTCAGAREGACHRSVHRGGPQCNKFHTKSHSGEGHAYSLHRMSAYIYNSNHFSPSSY